MGLERRRARERGSAALEFGITVPVILLMVFGIIQYGYLFWSLQTAAATAREAARQLVVGTDETCTEAQAVGRLRQPAVGPGGPTVDIVYADAGGAPRTPNTPVPGGLVTVTVSFQSLDLHLPFLPVPRDGTVTQDASARVENVPAAKLGC
jgi:Flp pilus assembly protein TadG